MLYQNSYLATMLGEITNELFITCSQPPQDDLTIFLEPKWAIDSEATRARGIIGLVKSN